ncbi:MAG: nucleoside deaminase [Alphaproteobacteria bacterium]|nr:nucleoside deaminase [Alphaproteobacteria bacterium]
MKKRKSLNNFIDNSDEYFMSIALKEAKKAYAKDEVPIGAVLVSETKEIIAKAHNTAEYGTSALEHAEMKVMQKSAKKLKTSRLWGATLYVTIEPCTMCATAISMMRIKRLVFGAENKKGGAVLNGVKFFESSASFHKPEIISHVLEKQTSEILTDFFKNKRK